MKPMPSAGQRPPATTFEQALAAIERINQRRQTTIPDFFQTVRELVVIASSSRGGSSIFTEILRHSPQLVHCTGEINPFLTLAGLSYPASDSGSDSLGALDVGPHNQAKLAALAREMAADAGVNTPVDLTDDSLRQRFIDDLAWRLTVQWPEVAVASEVLGAAVEQTFAELCQHHGWPAGAFVDPAPFHLLLIGRLRQHYPSINPYSYDCDPELIRRLCPEARVSAAPPSEVIIEEPPFVMISPRHPLTTSTLAARPLILKTPSNVYRLAFLRHLFPQARMRIIHLTRHPAASINGLVDGWLYHGFFSHPLPRRLAIAGYSNRFPDWGQTWWKYDLPPGWQEWLARPLPEVCGFQWRAAHQATLDFIDRHPVDSLRVRFEDVIADPGRRRRCFGELADWLGIDPTPLITASAGELPPVMATCPPRRRRWFKNAALLQPALNDPATLALAAQLGYDVDDE